MAHTDTARGTADRARLTLVTPTAQPPRDADALRPPSRRRRPRLTPHLTADEYIRLLAFIEDQGGIVTIDEVARALPRVARPVSAVFDLCDAGILNVDWEDAFDGDMRVWRIDR